MSGYASKQREVARKVKREERQQRREHRRAAKRAGYPCAGAPPGGDGHASAGDLPERVCHAPDGNPSGACIHD
jgi:hypothetical protein